MEQRLQHTKISPNSNYSIIAIADHLTDIGRDMIHLNIMLLSAAHEKRITRVAFMFRSTWQTASRTQKGKIYDVKRFDSWCYGTVHSLCFTLTSNVSGNSPEEDVQLSEQSWNQSQYQSKYLPTELYAGMQLLSTDGNRSPSSTRRCLSKVERTAEGQKTAGMTSRKIVRRN